MFYQFAFSDAELFQMFKDFHRNFFPDNKIGEKEVAALFEYMA